jgi:hypothetical protein
MDVAMFIWAWRLPWGRGISGGATIIGRYPPERGFTQRRTALADLPDPTHPVVVLVPSRWGPDGELPTSTHHINEVVARLAAIDDVVVFVAPALMDARGPGAREYGDADVEDAIQWAMARHERRRT